MNAALDKSELRRVLERRRAEAARRDPEAGVRLASAFPRDLLPAADVIVSGYVAFRTEIDPAPLLKALVACGARLALPRTPPKGAGAPLSFHLVEGESALHRSAFGVLEPDAACPIVEPDLVLAPLLGFDRAGTRLGYGQGHYDRTIAHLRARKPLVVAGLAFADQEEPALPRDPHDAPLDWIVTPDFALRFR